MPLRRFLVLIVLALAHLTLRAQTPAKTFVVNTTTDGVDSKPGDNICAVTSLPLIGTMPACSLRAAIDEATLSPQPTLGASTRSPCPPEPTPSR